MSTRRSGVSSSAKRQRVGEDQAAFRIGVADFDVEAFARRIDVRAGRNASPATEFSTAGIKHAQRNF